MPEKRFHDQLKSKANSFVHYVYQLTKSFPPAEIYGVTSQLRRSSLSVILNYIEGYARNNKNVDKNFLRIAYGSLKEAQYLIEFSFEEKYLTKEDYIILAKETDEIGAMLWSTLSQIN